MNNKCIFIILVPLIEPTLMEFIPYNIISILIGDIGIFLKINIYI